MVKRPKHTLVLHPEQYTIHRLAPSAAVPTSLLDSPFCSVTRTPSELSVVTQQTAASLDHPQSPGWRALSVMGPLDFALVGVLAGLAGILADAQVSVFTVSTYDTDWLFVQSDALARARQALEAEGHVVREDSTPPGTS